MLYNKNRPTLILDKEKVLINIQRFVNLSFENNLAFRPHFKTHQSKEIGKWFQNFGVEKITVSSFTMAKYFAEAGWKNILIAFPLNTHEIEGIKDLSKNITLNITIASLDHVKALVQSKANNVGIYLKIDTGYGRSGIDVHEQKEIQKILEELKNYKYNFIGFLAHFGHTYHTKSKEEIVAIYKEELPMLQKLKTQTQKFYPNAIISIGDTPGLCQITDYWDIDEIRPGNFVFFDCMQENLGACKFDDIAVALACPIVEINAKQEKIVIYGGAVHLSKESIIKNGIQYFGTVVQFEDRKWSNPIEHVYVKSLSQEHGILHCPKEKIMSFKVGDIIGILPVHSCLTANLMKGYYDFNGRSFDHLNNFA